MNYFTKKEEQQPKASTIEFLKMFARNYRAVEVQEGVFVDLWLS